MNSQTKLSVLCDKLIEAGWLAALVIVPLFFNVYSSRVFEPDKITTLRSIAVMMSVAWLIKMIEQGFRSSHGGQPALDQERSRGGLWGQIIKTPLVLPTLALVVIYLISTVFSVVPRVSFVGSYQRLQGTYSTLSYIIVFTMMLLQMRTKAQIERLVTTVVLTSVPIALYGVLQHYGLDPLPWGGDVQARVASNMGNAIFVAAYLIMALPLTLYRTVESFIAILTAQETNWVDIILGAAYIFIVAIQSICIFFTKSRGPWLGLIGGLFFFFLVLAVVRRWRWLVWGSVILMLIVAAFLVVFNLPNTPLEPLKSVPYIGRLGQALDKGQRTSTVRLLIWEGAIDMVMPHSPLEQPNGAKDRMNWARPVIGYGPESMYVAYNRFYPPDLAHYEARNASPDRSHNETFDSLVITGIIGFLVYMWLFASVFYFGFKWLGIIASTMQRVFFVACWIGGGILGALVMSLWQGIEFFGVGLPAGIAAGLGVYLVVWGLFLSGHQEEKPEGEFANPYQLLVVALVAAIIAHFVEIHFGIAIGATRTYFWIYAGLLVAVGYLLPRQWEIDRQIALEQVSEDPIVSRRRRKRKSDSRFRVKKATQRETPSEWAMLIPYALILALILCTLAFDFVQNQNQLDSPQQVLWTALTKRMVKKELVPSYGVIELVGITWLLGGVIVVLEWMRRGGKGNLRRLLGMCLSIAFVIAFLFAMVLAGRLASVVRRQQLLEVTSLVMGMLTSYYVLIFGLIVAMAFSLLREVTLPPKLWQAMTVWIHPVLVIVLVLVIVNSNLRVVHADMIYKQAEPYERQNYWDFSIILHQKAIERVPREDFYFLFLGRAFLEKSKSAQTAERLPRAFKWQEVLQLTPQQMDELSRGDLLNCSDAVLNRAREINPLNTDHSANLGRLYRTRAELEADPERKQVYFDKSLKYYAQATSLSPNAAHLFDEWGLVYFVMREYDEAIAKYEYSLDIDPEYINTYLSLGDAYMAVKAYAQAEEAYLKAVEIDPDMAQVHSVLAYLYGREDRIDEAISETLQVLELTNNKQLVYNSYKNLALYYQQVEKPNEAMQAANEALARAPENERAAIQGLIGQLSQGGAAPEANVLIQQFLSEGDVALNSQQWAEAEAAYDKALGLDPNSVVAHSALAYIYAQQGRLQEAERANQIVLAAIPGDFATLKNLAIIYRQLARYDDAIAYAQQASESPSATQEDKTQLQVFINEIQNLKSQQ
ncbi:MAG: O-antigen ligase family protein [Anaerolineae bacterium]|nr:O-antigen ligase family protein [Anaerolineae bacterium]